MNDVKTNSCKAWLLASRPKTLTGALIPVALAASLVCRERLRVIDGTEREEWVYWIIALSCALFACFMQIAANFINDLYDFLKGTDREDRLGPKRACAQGWITPKAMKVGIAVVVIIACMCGMVPLFLTWELLPWHGWELVVMGVSCVVFAFLYTTVFSYLGLGDLLVLVFFGLVPVCGTYYVMNLTLNADCLILSMISGIAIDALLVVNNYRDREQDRVSGKNTIVVRLGERFGRYLYLFIGILVSLLIVWLLVRLSTSWFAFVLAIVPYLLLHYVAWRQMTQIDLNIILGKTSRNMLLMAVFLSMALLLA